MKKIYGYARVSTKEQHLDRQIKALQPVEKPALAIRPEQVF